MESCPTQSDNKQAVIASVQLIIEATLISTAIYLRRQQQQCYMQHHYSYVAVILVTAATLLIATCSSNLLTLCMLWEV